MGLFNLSLVENCFIVVLLYVDDISIVGSNQQVIEEFKDMLKMNFKLRDIGNLKYFIGMEVARSWKGISICQRKYTLDLLQEYGV